MSASSLEEQLKQLCLVGNQFLVQEMWTSAAGRYTLCIDQALSHLQERGSHENNGKDDPLDKPAPSRENLNPVLLLAYTNRAETRLRLRSYRTALSDTDKALEINPLHFKSLARKAKALHGLCLFREACSAFEAAFAQRPNEPSILESLRKSATAFERSSEFPAEFMGPLEIRRVAQRGFGKRGLFATRAVKLGELLLVSEPLALTGVKSPVGVDSSSSDDTGVQCAELTALDDELVLLDLIGSLLEHRNNKRKMAQLFSLSSDQRQEREIPPMDLFRPGSEWAPEDWAKFEADAGLIPNPGSGESVDTTVILRNIIKLNAMNTVNYDDQSRVLGSEHRTGLWILPAFANHSCAPNVHSVFALQAICFRASADIEKGDELTTTYIDQTSLFESVGARRAMTRSHPRPFTCRCERCLFEESVEPPLWTVHTFEPSAVVDQVEWMIRSQRTKLTPKQQGWIRTLYQDGYAGKLQQIELDNDIQSRIEFVKLLELTLDAIASVFITPNLLKLSAILLEAIMLTYEQSSEYYHSNLDRVRAMYRVHFGDKPSRVLDEFIKSSAIEMRDRALLISDG